MDKLLATLEVLKKCCKALDDKKAIDIRVLKVAGKSSITDYFVIATATSEPHINALKKELEREFTKLHIENVKINYMPQSGWAVIDGFDFIIHIFVEETRDLYRLEDLWKDAEEIHF